MFALGLVTWLLDPGPDWGSIFWHQTLASQGGTHSSSSSSSSSSKDCSGSSNISAEMFSHVMCKSGQILVYSTRLQAWICFRCSQIPIARPDMILSGLGPAPICDGHLSMHPHNHLQRHRFDTGSTRRTPVNELFESAISRPVNKNMGNWSLYFKGNNLFKRTFRG